MASASRPESASRGRRQVSNSQRVSGARIISAAVTGDRESPSRSPVVGVGGRDGLADAVTGSSETGGSSVPTVAAKTASNSQGAHDGRPRREEHHFFEAARPANRDITSSRIPSPDNLQEGLASTSRSAATMSSKMGKRGRPTLGIPPTTVRCRADAIDPTPAGATDSDVDEAAAEENRRRGKQTLGDGTFKAALAGGTRRDYTENSGCRGSSSDTSPKVLLAREAQAALRRAKRLAAAKHKEEEELRLSCSFRAKEVGRIAPSVKQSRVFGSRSSDIVGCHSSARKGNLRPILM